MNVRNMAGILNVKLVFRTEIHGEKGTVEISRPFSEFTPRFEISYRASNKIYRFSDTICQISKKAHQ